MLVWVVKLCQIWYYTSFWFRKAPVFHEDCGTFQADSESLSLAWWITPLLHPERAIPHLTWESGGRARDGSCSGIIITILRFLLTWQPQAPTFHCLVLKHACEKERDCYQNRRCISRKKLLSFIHPPTGTAPPRWIACKHPPHSSEGPLRQSLKQCLSRKVILDWKY